MGFWGNLWGAAKSAATSVVTTVKNVATTVATGLRNAYNNTKKLFQDRGDKIASKESYSAPKATTRDTIDTNNELEKLRQMFGKIFKPAQDSMETGVFQILNSQIQQLHKQFPEMDMSRLTYNRQKIVAKMERISNNIRNKISRSNPTCSALMGMAPGNDKRKAYDDFIDSLFHQFVRELNSQINTIVEDELECIYSAIDNYTQSQIKNIETQSRDTANVIKSLSSSAKDKEKLLADAEYRKGYTEIVLSKILKPSDGGNNDL